VVLAGVLALLLSGCGGGSGTQAAGTEPAHLIHLALDAAPGPETVGLTMANRRGYFKEAGISVLLGQPVTLSNAFGYLQGESVDLIVAPMSQVILEKGASLLAVRSLVDASTEALIRLPGSGIDRVADLKGKTIAIPGLGAQEQMLEVVLAQAGLDRSDVKVRSLPYTSTEALASGRVDAIFGGSWNVEGEELRARGLRPTVTRLGRFGIPPFEQAVLLGSSYHLPNKEILERFMAAAERGTEAAIEDPAAAARVLAEERSEPKRNAARWRAELKATLPLLSRSGQMDIPQAERLEEWMYGKGLLEFKTAATDAVTNRYLATSEN
jgi:putative hydroxymethylpyrimidine transport system substrate-binding protein